MKSVYWDNKVVLITGGSMRKIARSSFRTESKKASRIETPSGFNIFFYTCGRLRRKTLYIPSALAAPSTTQVSGLSTR